MKHKAHQSEIPGTDQIFNLAAETALDLPVPPRKNHQGFLLPIPPTFKPKDRGPQSNSAGPLFDSV